MKINFTKIYTLILALLTSLTPIAAKDYYELVHENLRPGQDEFYVNGIFSDQEDTKASIARSRNKRAGELYTNYILYGVGDHLSNQFVIEKIDTETKQVIVHDTKENKYYSLQMSYGQATSRLILMSDYKD